MNFHHYSAQTSSLKWNNWIKRKISCNQPDETACYSGCLRL